MTKDSTRAKTKIVEALWRALFKDLPQPFHSAQEVDELYEEVIQVTACVGVSMRAYDRFSESPTLRRCRRDGKL